MFDILAALVLIVSAIVGFSRGATRELVSVISFLAAVALAVMALRYTAPFALTVIKTEWIAKALAVLVVFVIVYVILRIIGGGLARRIHETDLGSLDRVIGLGFGLVRGLIVLGVFSLVFSAAIPAEQMPAWVTGAKLYPLTEVSADALRSLEPKGAAMADKVAPALKRAVGASVDPPPDEKGDKSGK